VCGFQVRLREAESSGRDMKEDFQQLNAFYNAEKTKQIEMQQALTRAEQQISALAMVREEGRQHQDNDHDQELG
jgi:hypothetical protein